MPPGELDEHKKLIVSYCEVYANYLYKEGYSYCNHCFKSNGGDEGIVLKVCACQSYCFCSKDCLCESMHDCLYLKLQFLEPGILPFVISLYIKSVFDHAALDVVIRNFKKGIRMCQFCDWCHPSSTCGDCNSPFIIVDKETDRVRIVRCYISQAHYRKEIECQQAIRNQSKE